MILFSAFWNKFFLWYLGQVWSGQKKAFRHKNWNIPEIEPYQFLWVLEFIIGIIFKILKHIWNFWYPDLAWSDQKRALKQEHSRKLPSKTFLSLEIWSLLFSLNEKPGWSLGHRTTYYFLLLFSSEESLNLSINVKESKKLQKFKIYAWSSIRYLQMHSYECTFLCICCLWQ